MTVDAAAGDRGASFYAGLFAVTAATLLLELLGTRLLSVVTWYHLSFFAVSSAMFGMAAGAVRVYLDRREHEPRRWLAESATGLAISIPVCHLVQLVLPVPVIDSLSAAGALAIAAAQMEAKGASAKATTARNPPTNGGGGLGGATAGRAAVARSILGRVASRTRSGTLGRGAGTLLLRW